MENQKSLDNEQIKPQSSPNARRGWRTSKVFSWKSSMSSGKSSIASSMASSDGSFSQSLATSIDDHSMASSCNRLNSIYDGKF